MLAAVCVLIPVSLGHPFIAYALWAWTAAVSASYYLYGFMAAVRFNLIFACIALLSLLLSNRRWYAQVQGRQQLLVLFLLHATLCWIFGFSPNHLNGEVYEDLVKALIFALVLPAFVTDRLRLHALLVVLGVGMGFHGVVEGAKFVASGGGHRILGVSTAMISDNNHFAVGQLMILPVLLFLYRYSSRRAARIGFLFASALVAFSVVGTFSRGGFIGLSALGIWFFLSSRRKLLSLMLVGAAAMVLVMFAPDAWFARIDTIGSANKDSSFMTRVFAWKVSTVIALDHPIFGGGFHAVQTMPVWSAYKDRVGLLDFIPTTEIPTFGRAAHSIYFEVLGDMGFVGLFLFLAIWGNAWRTALSVKRASEKRPDLIWARDLSDMLRLSLVAYAISGAAVSMAYFELFYTYAAIIAVLDQYVKRKTAKAARTGAGAFRISDVGVASAPTVLGGRAVQHTVQPISRT